MDYHPWGPKERQRQGLFWLWPWGRSSKRSLMPPGRVFGRDRERRFVLRNGERAIVIGAASSLALRAVTPVTHNGIEFTSIFHALLWERCRFWSDFEAARGVAEADSLHAATLIIRQHQWPEAMWRPAIKAALIRILRSKVSSDEAWTDDLLRIPASTKILAAGFNLDLECGAQFDSTRLRRPETLPGRNLYGLALKVAAANARIARNLVTR